MRALSEYLFDITHRREHYLSAHEYNNIILDLYYDIEKLYAPVKKGTAICKTLSTLDELRNHPTSENISTLISIVQVIQRTPPSMFGQRWYLQKMRAMGYRIDFRGHCYGMAHMALSAFLAEDFSTFMERLDTIYDLSVDELKKNAGKINNPPVRSDILAFFDNLVVYQAPQHYSHLVGEYIGGQNAERMRGVLSPICFTTQPHRRPLLMQVTAGSYQAPELIEVLNLLKKQFHSFLFSLVLIANQHAITLNYHPEQQWTLVDPNQLPGEDYLRTELLVEAIFKAFFSQAKIASLYIRSYLYTQTQNQLNFKCQLTRLLAHEAWQKIHDPNKANLSCLVGDLFWGDELSAIQDLLDQGITVTDFMFIECCTWGSIQAANLLLSTDFRPTQLLLDKIYFNTHRHAPLAWGQWIKTLGFIPSTLLLEAALKSNDMSMVNALLRIGVRYLSDTFYSRILQGQVYAPDAFLIQFIFPFLSAMKISLEKGEPPIEKMLYVASRHALYKTMNLLMDWGTTLSCASLNLIFAMNQPQVTSLLIARHIDLFRWSIQMNEKKLNLVSGRTHNNYRLNLSSLSYLALLKHLKQNGFELSQSSLEFACWSGKIECVHWLLQQGVTLPDDVLTRLRPRLSNEILARLTLKQSSYKGFFDSIHGAEDPTHIEMSRVCSR